MKLIKTYSSKGDRRGCIPCALSALTGRSYDDINAWLQVRGYRSSNNRGTKTYLMDKREFGLQRITEYDGISVNQLLNKNISGSLFVLVNGHGLTIKDGIAYDTIDSCKRIVKQVYKRVEDKLPYDLDLIAKDWKDIEKKKQREVKQEERRKAQQLIYKQQKKSDDFKIAKLQERAVKWNSKLKRCKSALSKIEKQLKYYERKQIKK